MAHDIIHEQQRQDREVDDSVFETLAHGDQPCEGWNSYNLLTLDGGGIRGYWSLLVLKKLMECIADTENEGEPHSHSFRPQPWQVNVSQVEAAPEEEENYDETDESTVDFLPKSKRFLPCHYFDYIGGSSTGALIAMMLGTLRMTVLDCMTEYKLLGGSIFGSPRSFAQIRVGLGNKTKYKSSTVETVFKDVIKRRQEKDDKSLEMIFQTKKGTCRTFATALMTDTQRQNPEVPYLIRSYKQIDRFSPNDSRASTGLSRPMRAGTGLTGRTTRMSTGLSNQASPQAHRRPRRIHNGQHEFRTWQAARAATAAPFFFEPLKLELQTGNYLDFRDGGFGYTNNPAKVGITEIEHHHGDNSVGVIVSVGTARKDRRPRDTGILSLSSKLEDIASKATDPEKVHDELKEDRKYNDRYFRFNNPDSLDVKLDEWEPKGGVFTKSPTGSKTIRFMEDDFAQWIGEGSNLDSIRECAEQLVRRRWARKGDDARWERYATGAEFTCRRNCGSEWSNRDQFEEHLKSAHQVQPDQLKSEIIECRAKWRYQKRR